MPVADRGDDRRGQCALFQIAPGHAAAHAPAASHGRVCRNGFALGRRTAGKEAAELLGHKQRQFAILLAPPLGVAQTRCGPLFRVVQALPLGLFQRCFFRQDALTLIALA